MSSQQPTPYTGPSAAHMLATRTFASCVITNHGTNNEILDDRELTLLKEFVENPGNKDDILRKHDMLDILDHKGNRKGSLTGLVIARYGTSESAMNESDVENLKRWFEGGNAGV